MVYYLIEFRFQGKTKKKIKSMISGINKKFHLQPANRQVPHITLVGPLATNKEDRLIQDFNRICSSYPLMNFIVKGFNTFEHSRVVYIDIEPSDKLEEFRRDLVKRLKSYCKLKSLDYDSKFYYHAALAKKLETGKFREVKKYVDYLEKPNFKQIIIRITLLKGNYILREYDFLLRKNLTRQKAKNSIIYKQTISKLKDYFKGIYVPFVSKKQSLWNKLKSLFK